MRTQHRRYGLVAIGTLAGLFFAFGLRGSQGVGLLSSLQAPTNIAASKGVTSHNNGLARATSSGTATGSLVNYYFGTVAVRVVVKGGRVTSVTTPSLNDGGNPRSVQIDQYALPILTQEALGAQSANIQSVSGASYTSAGFAQSLQSALSKLGR